MAQLSKRTRADGRERHHDRPGGRGEARHEVPEVAAADARFRVAAAAGKQTSTHGA